MPVEDAEGVAAGARLTLSVFDGPCTMGSQSRRPTVPTLLFGDTAKMSSLPIFDPCRTLAKADPLLNCLAIESVKAEVLHRLWVWMIQEVVGSR